MITAKADIHTKANPVMIGIVVQSSRNGFWSGRSELSPIPATVPDVESVASGAQGALELV